jgi:hypothetical protein
MDISNKITSTHKRVEIAPESDSEKHELAQHPRKKEERSSCHRCQTRHRGESLILQRRQHLRDVDDEADEDRDRAPRPVPFP